MTRTNREPALVYLRISEDKTGEEAGVDRQREDCERRARERGWRVVAVESDNDISATTGRRRPGFEAMLTAIASGRVRYVIAWHLDRLQRNRRDELRFYELCREHKIVVSLVRGPDLEWETPTGRYLADNLGAAARLEVEQKGDRQKRANQQRAEKGEARWTRRPFGLDRVDGEVVVVDSEAAALATAVERVLAGATLASVVRELHAAGSRTSLGKPHTVTGLRRILLNQRYAGRSMHNGADVADGTWPILIEPETQRRLCDILRDPKRRLQQGVELKYMLSGAVFCGRCGGRMYATAYEAKGMRYMILRCRDGNGHLVRRMDAVEELVESVVLGRLAMPDAARLLAPDVDLDALRREADDVRQRRDGIAQLLGEGLLSVTAAREEARKLTDALRDVEATIGAAMSTSPAAELALADDVREVWAGLPMRSRRAILDLLVEVTLLPAGRGKPFDPNDVQIRWKN